MKKSFISVLTATAVIFGMVSCNNNKAKNDEAAQEEAAVIAGNVPKNVLTEELKVETIQFLKDMPNPEIPYRIAAGEVSISVGNSAYMLPVTKVSELTTTSQKARALGMYLADYNTLEAAKQTTTEVSAALTKLVADLNITFLTDIVKEQAPKNATKEQFQDFYQKQEEQIINALAKHDKINLAVEILGGASAEYACLIANPSLAIKGDATNAGLTEKMEKRVSMLGEITNDLAAYYPELKELNKVIAPLSEKITSIQTARNNNEEIMEIRNALLK